MPRRATRIPTIYAGMSCRFTFTEASLFQELSARSNNAQPDEAWPMPNLRAPSCPSLGRTPCRCRMTRGARRIDGFSAQPLLSRTADRSKTSPSRLKEQEPSARGNANAELEKARSAPNLTATVNQAGQLGFACSCRTVCRCQQTFQRARRNMLSSMIG